MTRTGTSRTSTAANDDDKQDDDGQRGEEAREAAPLEPVGHRIEGVGQRHAGDKGQKDRAKDEKEQDQDDDEAEPEQDLPMQAGHGASPCRGGGAEGAPLSPTPMWRIQSRT